MTNILPDIYFFNPTCEYEVANGTNSWQPNRLLQTMENDLATLQSIYANPKDIMLVPQKPSENFIESFQLLNIHLPEFVERNLFLKQTPADNLQLGKLLPWGWSPTSHKLLSSLKPFCSDEFKKSPVFTWKEEYKKLYSKGFSLTILKEFISAVKGDFLLSPDYLPEICTTKYQIEKLLNNWGQLMVKAPWSSSGRGLQPITKTPVHSKVWEKILGIINNQGFVVVEPFLKKAADLAFQFKLQKEKISFLGISYFTTDNKGQYQGNYFNNLSDYYEKEVIDFIEFVPKKIIQPLIEIIENSELAKSYEGNFGVDTLIFRDDKNQLRINPCLEINVRQNMGLLSLYLKNLIFPEKKAIYRTYFHPGVPFKDFTTKMGKEHPLVINSYKIESGFFPLTCANKDSQFGAYILI